MSHHSKDRKMAQPQYSESHSPRQEDPHQMHDNLVQNEAFAENMIRQEAAQQHERALAARISESESMSGSDDRSVLLASLPLNDSEWQMSIRLYRSPSPSSATPMERFATVSTVNEPFRMLAKNNMDKSNLGVGCLDSMSARASAARHIADELRNSKKQHQGAVSSPSTLFQYGQAESDMGESDGRWETGQNRSGDEVEEDGRNPERHQAGQ